MRLRTWTATSTSVARRSSVCARNRSPITCFHLAMAASARARVVPVLVVRTIPREGGHRPRHLVEQGTGLGAIIDVGGGQRGGDDLAGVGVHAEMQLSPRPPHAGAVLLEQPLAGPAQLEPRAVW